MLKMIRKIEGRDRRSKKDRKGKEGQKRIWEKQREGWKKGKG